MFTVLQFVLSLDLYCCMLIIKMLIKYLTVWTACMYYWIK